MVAVDVLNDTVRPLSFGTEMVTALEILCQLHPQKPHAFFSSCTVNVPTPLLQPEHERLEKRTLTTSGVVSAKKAVFPSSEYENEKFEVKVGFVAEAVDDADRSSAIAAANPIRIMRGLR